MKKNKLKIITITLLIVLVTMISFFGVYVQVQNRMENKVKDYELAMDLKGARKIVLQVNKETKEIIKDKDGNVVENATDEEITQNGYTKENVPNNTEESLNIDNYKLCKKIIDERLKKLEVGNYVTRLDEQTGEIIIELPENTETNDIVNSVHTMGKFEIIDTDTKEVLLTNKDVKTSTSGKTENYGNTAVFFNIEFNNEGKKKFEDITRKYVPSTEETKTEETDTEENTTENSEENKSTEKTITMKIDDETIMSTSFDTPITDGKFQLSVGQASADSESLKDNERQAKVMTSVISNESMPIKYDLESSRYIATSINSNTISAIIIASTIILAIALIVLMIRYKSKGMLATISYIGLLSLFLLTIRYTNVVLSLEGIFAIFIVLILNYIFENKILSNLKKEEKNRKATISKVVNMSIKDMVIKIIPLFILSIVFCFIGWVPTSSFGMVMFWGITLIIIYNLIVTKTLLKYSENK